MWNNCIGLCTDGARSMSGHKSGFRALFNPFPASFPLMGRSKKLPFFNGYLKLEYFAGLVICIHV